MVKLVFTVEVVVQVIGIWQLPPKMVAVLCLVLVEVAVVLI